MSRQPKIRRAPGAVGRVVRRGLSLLGPPAGARQSLIALFLNSSTSMVAGGFLGSITGTLEKYPGLLVMVPAAIGLRGNVFSTVGSRLSTAIHTGTARFSLRRESVLGQNVMASVALTLGMSLALAVVAKLVAIATGVQNTIPVSDLALISIVGGALGSALVLALTLGLTAGAVRYGWDLDNVIAPTVSVLGDVLTLPALWVATLLVGRTGSTWLGVGLIAVAALALVGGLRSKFDELRRIVRESVPVLLAAGVASSMAGVVLERRLQSFTALPALLILVPTFLSSAGALGGIVASRLATKLHLGFTAQGGLPDRTARLDMLTALVLGIPVFLFNAAGTYVTALIVGRHAPGLARLFEVSMLGGFLAVCLAVVIAYYTAVSAARVGVDPDSYGIPVVTSGVDFAGAFSLILVVVLLGLA